jgi:hypothetical protein
MASPSPTPPPSSSLEESNYFSILLFLSALLLFLLSLIYFVFLRCRQQFISKYRELFLSEPTDPSKLLEDDEMESKTTEHYDEEFKSQNSVSQTDDLPHTLIDPHEIDRDYVGCEEYYDEPDVNTPNADHCENEGDDSVHYQVDEQQEEEFHALDDVHDTNLDTFDVLACDETFGGGDGVVEDVGYIDAGTDIELNIDDHYHDDGEEAEHGEFVVGDENFEFTQYDPNTGLEEISLDGGEVVNEDESNFGEDNFDDVGDDSVIYDATEE